ncbi:hypothetical protein F5985_17790 [Malikia spinosa]|uniref:Tetraacyldisaccharide 4'-kinase n=1 Tax=Malikia spinosa TaxID=86180 RepID=A0A7C9J034_9BURK|nr:hypothetical protein [Malikia spinosa]
MTLSSRLLQAWQRRGPLAALLWPVSQLYAALMGLRRLAYRSGIKRSERLPVPVLVVGNVVVGGAGKTPTVIALLRHLRAQGWTPGVISRGYGREGDGCRVIGPDSSSREAGTARARGRGHRRPGTAAAAVRLRAGRRRPGRCTGRHRPAAALLRDAARARPGAGADAGAARPCRRRCAADRAAGGTSDGAVSHAISHTIGSAIFNSAGTVARPALALHRKGRGQAVPAAGRPARARALGGAA